MSPVHLGALAGGLLGMTIGGLFGPFAGMIGLIIGLYQGAQFGRGFAQGGGIRWGSFDPRRTRDIFIRTSFQVMGHLSKSDGRVSEREIGAARSIMYQMRLTPEQIRQSIDYFTEGKRADFPLREALREFRRYCHFHQGLIRAFVELQVQVALVSGGIHPAERQVIWIICQELGVDRAELAQIEELVRMQMGGGQRRDASPQDELARACKVLGVAGNASDREVKTAYRRLMNQHHPDKLVARGLPEAMLEEAKIKVREIRSAYDLIKKSRGMR